MTHDPLYGVEWDVKIYSLTHALCLSVYAVPAPKLTTECHPSANVVKIFPVEYAPGTAAYVHRSKVGG